MTLRLPFATYPSKPFNQDVHQLHLPYLSSIALLHMKKSTKSAPTAQIPAILAASCVARIFEDLLERGSLRFLQGMAGWHIAIALLALLHARKVKVLKQEADSQISILRIAMKEMGRRWASANMFDKAIERLLSAQERPPLAENDLQTRHALQGLPTPQSTLELLKIPELASAEGQDVSKYFPGATRDTSPLFAILLFSGDAMSFSDPGDTNDLSVMLYDLFDNTFDSINYDDSWNPSWLGAGLSEYML